MLEVLTLAGDSYRLRGFMPVDEARSSTIPELKLRLAKISADARGETSEDEMSRLTPRDSSD
jgi:hypothetical protein